MDVQQAAPPATTAAALPSVAQFNPPVGPQQTLQSEPPAAAPAPVAGADSRHGIEQVVAKLFGDASNPTPLALNVSYKVVDQQIVTVFTDPKTGKEVAQFPPELIMKMAEFFDKHQGATLDKSA